MTTGEAQTTIAYQGIVGNLLALRGEARDSNHGEVEAIDRILASVMSLQLIDRFSRMPPTLATRKSIEPVLPRSTERTSKNALPLSTENRPKVLSFAELIST